MSRQLKVASVAELQPGGMKLLSLAGIGLAVFNIEGRFYAIRNRCPHEGGPVATGPLKGTIITCPRHGWQFDLTTGQSTNRGAFSVKTYPVTVHSGAVYVELGDGF
ncbi:MAG TPA: Rieske 2Fe-2S domain-containing protein [Nitrospiria bacterium]|nr:Rieske 2Fe-2S domain-containing protein [Nitrospiria bacterium]